MTDPAVLAPSAVEVPPGQLVEAEILDNASALGDEVRCVVPSDDPLTATDPLGWTPVSGPAGVYFPKTGHRAVVSYQTEGPPVIAWWLPDLTVEPDEAFEAEAAPHTHTIAEVVGLQEALDAKANTEEIPAFAAPAATINAGDAQEAGVASTTVRSDHQHAVSTAAPGATVNAGDAAAEGVATSLARSDHQHPVATAAPGSIAPDDSASEGSSASLARADHRHAISAAAASTISGANAEGSSSSFARADHNHALGTGIVGTSHLAAGNRNYGLVSALPTSPTPATGDVCRFIANEALGIVWDLIYTGSKWSYIGGTPLLDEDNTSRSTESTSYVSLTEPLELTAPLAGDYLITIEAVFEKNGVGGQPFLSYAVGAMAANDNWALGSRGSVDGTVETTGSLTTRQAGVAKGATIVEKARRATAGAAVFKRRRLRVRPVRVE